MRKSEVTWRRVNNGYGEARASINIKLPYRTVEESVAKANREDPLPEGLTAEWIEQHVSDDHYEAILWRTCENEFEYFVEWAKEIIPGVTFEQDGRSGGWAVSNLTDENTSWDAVMLARWAKVCKIARQIADNVPEQVLYSIATNEWEWAIAERMYLLDPTANPYAAVA